MIYVFPTGGGAGDIAPGVKLSNLTLWQETTLAIQQFSIGKGERHSKDLRLLSTQLNSSQVYVPSIYLSIYLSAKSLSHNYGLHSYRLCLKLTLSPLFQMAWLILQSAGVPVVFLTPITTVLCQYSQ